jgi:hypothetical protein
MWLKRLVFILFMLGLSTQLSALDFEVIHTANEDGTPLSIDKIKILSVVRLFTTSKNNQDLVELSALAWSEDENILYALSDHGALFHFKPEFDDTGLSDIQLLDAFPLMGTSGEDLSYPWSDSEGLYLRNGNNGRQGDDELLVSFELKPRLQWHQPDGRFIKNEALPEWLEDKSNYYKRHKALESVTIHPEYGVITAPELPMEDADWQLLTLYQGDGGELTTSRDAQEDMSICAIETLPAGDLLILERRHSLLAPTWTTRLTKLSTGRGAELERDLVASITVGDRMPVDNYEGLTRHIGNRYFIVSDNNEHFMQQTLLVYFEMLP